MRTIEQLEEHATLIVNITKLYNSLSSELFSCLFAILQTTPPDNYRPLALLQAYNASMLQYGNIFQDVVSVLSKQSAKHHPQQAARIVGVMRTWHDTTDYKTSPLCAVVEATSLVTFIGRYVMMITTGTHTLQTNVCERLLDGFDGGYFRQLPADHEHIASVLMSVIAVWEGGSYRQALGACLAKHCYAAIVEEYFSLVCKVASKQATVAETEKVVIFELVLEKFEQKRGDRKKPHSFWLEEQESPKEKEITKAEETSKEKEVPKAEEKLKPSVDELVYQTNKYVCDKLASRLEHDTCHKCDLIGIESTMHGLWLMYVVHGCNWLPQKLTLDSFCRDMLCLFKIKCNILSFDIQPNDYLVRIHVTQ